MWYLKFRVRHHGCIFTPLTKELGVVDYAYPLGHVVVGGEIHMTALHVVDGSRAAIRKFVGRLKKNPQVLRVEGTGKVVFIKTREAYHREAYRVVYNPALLTVAPIINDKDGLETWQLACWDRAPLAAIVKLSKSPSIIESELLEFRRKEIHDVYITSLLPRLPPRQAEALRHAYESGYYAFPKKTELAELAAAMKISKATYQEHLRRAEGKILPFLLRTAHLTSQGK